MSQKSYKPSPAADIPTADQDKYLCEWLELCTILRCSNPARAFLARRGQKFFREFAKALQAGEALADILYQEYNDVPLPVAAGRGWETMEAEEEGTVPGNGADSPEETGESTAVPARAHLRERPWMLFESYMCVPGLTGRKPYKDLLMTMAEEYPDNVVRRVASLTAYIKLCYKAVVRAWVSNEAHEIRNSEGWIVRNTVREIAAEATDEASSRESIFNRISRSAVGGQEALEAQEFLPASLPDPVESADQSLLHSMAAEVAESVLPQITDPMRVALAARAFEVSLAHPAIEKFAGRRHTQLSGYLQAPDPGRKMSPASNLPTRINKQIEARYPDLDSRAKPFLRGAVLGILLAETKNWLKQPENADFYRFLQAQEQQA